ncbi:MAG: glucose 1-dehydrogenase [Congregibacter sp.]|nr:glucose 1-dehydrogenase [Congregibacter sp.]
MSQFNLSGKSAIVTGANGGIGRGIALALAEAGASICVAGRNKEKNEQVRAEIEALGAAVIALPCDVNDSQSIDETIEATVAAFGGLNILVNNAGIAALNSPEAMTDEEWTSVIDTNLTSVFKFSRAAHGALVAAGGGKIINIGSMYSLFGSPFAASYAASKGGVVQLSKSLAVSWAANNIQVNAILPGWIETDMTAPIETDMAELHAAIIARTPAGRFGQPEELGGTAVYLASSASDFVTGQSIPVCGGYSIA